MTGVPDGKNVTLSIANASAFTITASSGTLSATNNGYSYTGGNTTFTITPKVAGSVNETTPYSITFTDANDSDGVIVPETSISVKVMSERPAGALIWEGSEPINYYPGFTLPFDSLKDYLGEEMCVDVLVADHSNYKQIQFKKDGNDYQSFYSNSVTMTPKELITLKIIIPTDLTTAITIFGEGLTLKKFYIE